MINMCVKGFIMVCSKLGSDCSWSNQLISWGQKMLKEHTFNNMRFYGF